MKKLNQTVDVIPEKESKKPTKKQLKKQSQQIEVEIIQDKMNILNELDKQIRSSQWFSFFFEHVWMNEA